MSIGSISDKMNVVRLAIIGSGLIGKKHAEIAKHLHECTLVAVCDINKTAKQTAEEFGAKFYTDYQEMLEKEDLDGVIIAVPTDLHVPVGIICAQKGLHLLVEKPIAASVSDAESLIAAVRQNNIRLLVGHYRRFNPLVEMTRKIIRGGEIGKLVGVTILWTLLKPSEYFQASWRKSQGGGPILINLIHDIDNIRYICGEIIRVYAEMSNVVRKFPVEDSVSVALRFEDGAIGSILVSDCVPSMWSYEATTGENAHFFHNPNPENCYYFFGTKASFVFPCLKKVFYPRHAQSGWQYPVSTEEVEIVRSDPYQEQLKHFCHVVQGIENPRITGEDAKKTLEAALAIHKSGETGKPIRLNLAR